MQNRTFTIALLILLFNGHLLLLAGVTHTWWLSLTGGIIAIIVGIYCTYQFMCSLRAKKVIATSHEMDDTSDTFEG